MSRQKLECILVNSSNGEASWADREKKKFEVNGEKCTFSELFLECHAPMFRSKAGYRDKSSGTGQQKYYGDEDTLAKRWKSSM